MTLSIFPCEVGEFVFGPFFCVGTLVKLFYPTPPEKKTLNWENKFTSDRAILDVLSCLVLGHLFGVFLFTELVCIKGLRFLVMRLGGNSK